MTPFTKRPRRCVVPDERRGLYLGLLLYLLLAVVLMAGEARADDCQLSLSRSQIDYGLVRPDQQTLGARMLHLSIACTDPSTMALRLNGVAANGEGYRFGSQGRIAFSIKHARLDGQLVEWATPSVAGEHTTARLVPGQIRVAQSAGQPAMGRRLTAQVEIEATLPAAALRVRGETQLEGRAIFELVSPAGLSSR